MQFERPLPAVPCSPPLRTRSAAACARRTPMHREVDRSCRARRGWRCQPYRPSADGLRHSARHAWRAHVRWRVEFVRQAARARSGHWPL